MLFPSKTANFKAALGLAVLKVGALPLTILLSIILARALGPADYGRYAFFLSLATVLSIPAGQGVVALVLRETAQARQANDFSLMAGVRKRAHQFLILFTALVWLAGAVYVFFVLDGSQISARRSIYAAMVLFPVLSMLAIQAGVLQGLHHAFASQVGQLALRPGIALFLVFLALSFAPSFSLQIAFMTQIIAAVLALTGALILLRRFTPAELSNAVPRCEDQKWMSAVLPFALIAFANTFTAEIGILILGAVGNEVNAGALRVATSGAQLLSFPLFINNMILSPQAAQMFKAGQIEALAVRSRKFARLTFLVSALAGVPLILFAGPILAVTFGPEYIDIAKRPLQILSIGHLVNVSVGPAGMLLSMSGHEGSALWGQLITLLVVMILAVILAPLYGATGAALAVISGTIAGRVILVRLCVRILKFRPTVI
ncbi:polysaccharide biosynthesis C-terminal domain-containing protein [Celeribacter persicus]|uniref:O-antigen/teichoic acid export membrane protein n=1 Tax=Celeribacter persicus TaxID=1651082 RepID=A0A2T5H3R7_9RHOB|nr:polysaccharide biosynthesis C-terminal domain-containing protein [Celeribacter persicus]PTQ66228.1 O-antigen/teichoic acid export membrane protein [Celeribacter persicus]